MSEESQKPNRVRQLLQPFTAGFTRTLQQGLNLRSGDNGPVIPPEDILRQQIRTEGLLPAAVNILMRRARWEMLDSPKLTPTTLNFLAEELGLDARNKTLLQQAWERDCAEAQRRSTKQLLQEKTPRVRMPAPKPLELKLNRATNEAHRVLNDVAMQQGYKSIRDLFSEYHKTQNAMRTTIAHYVDNETNKIRQGKLSPEMGRWLRERLTIEDQPESTREAFDAAIAQACANPARKSGRNY